MRGGYEGKTKFVSLKWASNSWASIQNFIFPERKVFWFGWVGVGAASPSTPLWLSKTLSWWGSSGVGGGGVGGLYRAVPGAGRGGVEAMCHGMRTAPRFLGSRRPSVHPSHASTTLHNPALPRPSPPPSPLNPPSMDACVGLGEVGHSNPPYRGLLPKFRIPKKREIVPMVLALCCRARGI